MPDAIRWDHPLPLEEVKSIAMTTPGVVFADGEWRYATTGLQIGQGGMGAVYALERRHAAGDEIESVVGKVFRSEYLCQLRTDEVSRRDHERTLALFGRIAELRHPNLLPTYLSAPIADNHIIVTPRRAETLLEATVRGAFQPRRRVELLAQALGGLAALHDARLLHRDFTLRNVLLDEAARAQLFDFDLVMHLDDAAGASFRDRYQGRIYGSPGYSVPPEVLDEGLMDAPISERLDVYAAGGALFALFTDELPYGHTEDMWGLLFRISEGIVFSGDSRIRYPDAVPPPLRAIIDRCLERDPEHRFAGIREVLARVGECIEEIPDGRRSKGYESTRRYTPTGRDARLQAVVDSRRDAGVSSGSIVRVDDALARLGYQIQRSLGRIKGHAIFLAAPAPELLALGQFPDGNTYPKIVTAIDLALAPEADTLVDLWLGGYLPALRAARQGHLTDLYRVVHDEPTRHLFLFSEYVDDARFGAELDDQELTLVEALGLGFVVARQVARLHERGIAHNNVRAASLLFKGNREARVAHPAMVGLVTPSLAAADMASDVRNLARLILSWIRSSRVEAAEPRLRARLDEARSRLAVVAFDEAGQLTGIDWLIHVLADGLGLVDRNFGVLARHGGDLDAYARLLIGFGLYARLWR